MADDRSPGLLEAYSRLLHEIDRATRQNDGLGSQAFLAHDHDAAAQSLACAQVLSALKADVVSLRPRLSEVVRVLTPTPLEATPPAPALPDAPASGASGPAPVSLLRESWPVDNTKTPTEEYRVPILQALVELGGTARTAVVLERVHELMTPFLNEYDHASLPSKKNVPRWRNTAEWARLAMRDEGLLAADSPYGTWEITEAGRTWVSTHARRR